MYVISFILFSSYRKQLSTEQSCKRFNNSLLVPHLEADHMINDVQIDWSAEKQARKLQDAQAEKLTSLQAKNDRPGDDGTLRSV